MQDFQSLIIRQYFENLSSEFEFEIEDVVSSFAWITSTFISIAYQSFIERVSSSFDDSNENIEHEIDQDAISSSFHLTLSLYFERCEESRAKYVKLREVLQLRKFFSDFDHIDSAKTLSLKLNSFKRQIRRHVSLLKLTRKALSIIIEKQSSLVARKKGERKQRIERLVWQYWYDFVDLIRTILSATKLREKMHFDMTTYVDESIELWHFHAWDSSIRSCFEDVCYTQKDSFIISDDLVRIFCDDSTSEWAYTMSRVIFIERDHCSDALTSDEIILFLQCIVQRNHPILGDDSLNDDEDELFLVENINHLVSIDRVLSHLNAALDRDYSDDDNESNWKTITKETYQIRNIFNFTSKQLRSIRQLHSTREELKIVYFERQHFEIFFSISHTSFFYLLFIDDFGVHRNMYRALKAFYLISTCLIYEDRRKVINVFTLILSFHEAKILNVVKVFFRLIRQLDRELENMKIDEEKTSVCAFIMSLIGDMSQQADNGGFSRHNADLSCRSCFCSRSERANLEFDIVEEDRYHEKTINQRDYAEQLVDENQKRYLRDTNIHLKAPFIARLCSTLDLIQIRTYDASHSKWRDLERILHSFLVINILSKRDSTKYSKVFQNFSYSFGWFRIQSSTFYIMFWSLFETERASILLSLILRIHATMSWFRLDYLQTVEQIMKIKTSSLRAIVKAFDIIAHSNTLMNSQRYTYSSRLHEMVMKTRKVYQNFIKCVMSKNQRISVTIFSLNQEDASEKDFLEKIAEEGFLRHDRTVVERSELEVNVMKKVLFVVVNSDSANSKLDFTSVISAFERVASKAKIKRKGKRDRKSKEDKFVALLSLSNVHIDLHLADNAREYATIMNSNVLVGEMKHM